MYSGRRGLLLLCSSRRLVLLCLRAAALAPTDKTAKSSQNRVSLSSTAVPSQRARPAITCMHTYIVLEGGGGVGTGSTARARLRIDRSCSTARKMRIGTERRERGKSGGGLEGDVVQVGRAGGRGKDQGLPESELRD